MSNGLKKQYRNAPGQEEKGHCDVSKHKATTFLFLG